MCCFFGNVYVVWWLFLLLKDWSMLVEIVRIWLNKVSIGLLGLFLVKNGSGINVLLIGFVYGICLELLLVCNSSICIFWLKVSGVVVVVRFCFVRFFFIFYLKYLKLVYFFVN